MNSSYVEKEINKIDLSNPKSITMAILAIIVSAADDIHDCPWCNGEVPIGALSLHYSYCPFSQLNKLMKKVDQ